MDVSIVVNAVYTYGWYPALHLLAKLEKQEQFEKCAIIKKALDGLLVGRELEMTTKTDENSLQECFDKVIKNSIDQTIFINNIPKYITDFEKMVLK